MRTGGAVGGEEPAEVSSAAGQDLEDQGNCCVVRMPAQRVFLYLFNVNS